MSKKYLVLFTACLLTLAGLLAACSGTAATASTASSNNARLGSASNATGPLSPAAELLIGTYKLEGTPNAVDEKTAVALLPLWQMMKELSTNSSAAQAEIDAVVAQIKSTMSPAQLQAIADLHLTQRDTLTLMQELGLANGRTGASGTPSARTNNGGGFPGGGGEFPGGGGGGGFTAGGTNTGASAAQIAATAQAARSQLNSAAQIPSALLSAIIQFMEQKSGTTPTASETPSS
jgi:hypothetical protein